MSKAEVNLITIRHGRTRRMRILTKGRKVSNILTSRISRSSHPKLRVSQLEWCERIQEIYRRIENLSNVGNVEDRTCAGIFHSRIIVQEQLRTFKK